MKCLVNIVLVLTILATCLLPIAVCAIDPVYTGVQAVFNQERVRTSGGIPTSVNIGEVFFGFSLPLWDPYDNLEEELHYQVDVPEWWDGTSDILVRVHTATDNNEQGSVYELQLTSDYSTPNVDEAFPTAGGYSETIDRLVTSPLTIAHYMEVFTIPYDDTPADPITADDVLGLRIRHANTYQTDTLKGELIVINDIVVYFARGDLLGEEAGMEVALLLMVQVMALAVLGIIATLFTIAMFWKREPIAGWLGVVFWFLFGGANLALTVAVWDAYYYVGFASMLIGVLVATATFQFYRGTKKGREDSDFIDEEDRSQYTGETKKEAQQAERGDADDTMSDMPDDNIERRSAPSARTQALRDRAKRRKTGLGRKPWWKQ